MDTRDQSRDGFSYDFGRAVAHHAREKFDPRALQQLLQGARAYGGMPYEEALCGAFEEVMRLWEIDRRPGPAPEEVGWRGPTDRQAVVLEAADRWRKWMLDVDPDSVMSLSAASRDLVEAVDGLMLPDRDGRHPVTPQQERVLRAAAQWWQQHQLETMILDCDQELRVAVSRLVQRGEVTPGLEKVDAVTERSRRERLMRVVRASQAVRNHIRNSGLDRLLDGAATQELCAAVEVLQPGDVPE